MYGSYNNITNHPNQCPSIKQHYSARKVDGARRRHKINHR